MSKIQLSELFKSLNDKTKLQEIGSSVVREAIKRSILANAGLEIADVQLNIKKGELVPLGLRNDPEIKMDSNFIATSDHCKAWCKVEDYCKCWGKCTDDMFLEPGFFVRTELDQPLNEEFVKNIIGKRFSDKEIATLKTLKII